MASRKASTGKNGASSNNEGLVVHKIPLTEIDADYAWNARSGKLDVDAGDEEGNSFSELVSSLRANGQDEPVDVRPKKSGKGYHLTTGFRRFTALSKIAADDKTPGFILAYVRNDNELQARARNLRENTARDNLKGPDLAFGVHDLVRQQEKAGGNPSSVSVAAELGKNQPYINRLMNIMKKGDAAVTKLWRESPVKVGVLEMLQVVEHEGAKRQMEAFKEILAAKGNKGATRGPNAWVDTACSKAGEIGALLGRLHKAQLVDCEGLDFEDAEHLALIMKVNSKATAAQKTKIGKAARIEFDKALKEKAKTDSVAPPAN